MDKGFDILRLLADKEYRMILLALFEKPSSPKELITKLKIPKSTLYRKIRHLSYIGLIKPLTSNLNRRGRRFYVYEPSINFINNLHKFSLLASS